MGERELAHLWRCAELATQTLNEGDEPFGSVLVSRSGGVLAEDRNRENATADPTAQPEFALARWTGEHLDASDRASVTAYTSGEHCTMCTAAHGRVGIGRIVYIHLSGQLSRCRHSDNAPPG